MPGRECDMASKHSPILSHPYLILKILVHPIIQNHGNHGSKTPPFADAKRGGHTLPLDAQGGMPNPPP